MIWGGKKGGNQRDNLHPYCPSPTITKGKKATSSCTAGSVGTSQILLKAKHVNNISVTQARKAESKESFSLDEMSGDI